MKTLRMSQKPSALMIAVLLLACARVATAGINVWTHNGPEGGAVNALGVDPVTPTTMYAGTFVGVFKSTDGGGSWSAVLWNAGKIVDGVTVLAVDPVNPATVYAGTSAEGVRQSTDGGSSWIAMNAGLAGRTCALAFAFDPLSPSTLYAGTDAGVYDIEQVPPPPPLTPPTPTNTPTLTPTATPVSTAAATCGNGVLDAGEQCDDGNNVSGDGCSATCQSELIPGGGLIASDCTHEWRAALVPARNEKGMPMNRQTCTEGDPTCDFAPAGDNACTFHIAMCFNVAEQRFACTPTDIARVQLLQPPEAQPKDATAVANRDALETALEGLQGLVRGQCARPGSKAGQLCGANADCDSSPGSGNGLCKHCFVAFDPPLSTSNACTPFADISVPLRQTSRGFGSVTLKLKASPSNDPVTGKKRPQDTDSLTLVCKPHS